MNKLINGKFFLILFILTNIVYAVMVSWTIPTLMAYTNGIPIFDMRAFGYSYAEAIYLLDSLGPVGIDYYKSIQLPIDLVYPLLFMSTYSVGCVWIFRKLGWWENTGKIGGVVAIIAGLCDYIENIHIYKILDSYPAISEQFILSSSVSTILKTMTTAIAISILLIGLGRWFFLSVPSGKNGK